MYNILLNESLTLWIQNMHCVASNLKTSSDDSYPVYVAQIVLNLWLWLWPHWTSWLVNFGGGFRRSSTMPMKSLVLGWWMGCQFSIFVKEFIDSTTILFPMNQKIGCWGLCWWVVVTLLVHLCSWSSRSVFVHWNNRLFWSVFSFPA